jgi:hypothetical protein
MKTAFVLAALVADCAAIPPQPMKVAGDWGGAHVQLHLTPGGGTLDYDCAHGTIGPMRLGAGGEFTAEGTHTPEHGGPAREGEVLPAYPAHYSGVVRANRMTLDGRIDNGARLGPFELRRDELPMLTRCL